MQTSYSEKLRHPKWQAKRLEILSRDRFTCQLCSDTETELHVHHKSYKRGNEPWEYDDDNFQTLCKYCHMISEAYKDCSVNTIASSKELNKINGRFTLISIIYDLLDKRFFISIDRTTFDNSVENIVMLDEDQISVIKKLFDFSKNLVINA